MNREYVANAVITWDGGKRRGLGPTGTAIRTRSTVYIQDLAADPRMAPWRKNATAHGFRSAIALPLKDESDNVFGTLNLYSSEVNAFVTDEVTLLEELATDLAFGIVSMRTRNQRNEIRSKLEEQYSTLKSFIESTNEPVYAVDRKYKYTLYNEAHARMMRVLYGTEIVIGGNRLDYMTVTEDRQKVKEIIDRSLRGEYVVMERYWGREAAARHFLRTSHSPITAENGAVVGVAGLAQDLTQDKQIENALLQSEEGLQEAQHLGRIGSWEWNAQTDVIKWSAQYYKIYKVDPSKRPPGYEEHLKAYEPESAKRLDGAVKKSLATGEPYALDLELAGPKKNRRWVTARGEPIYDESRQIIGIRGTAQDITERKRAEEELSSREEQLKAVYNAIPDLVFRLNGNGAFLDYKADERDLYVQPQKIKGSRIREVLPPDVAELIEKNIKAAVETHKMQSLDYKLTFPGKGVQYFEARMVPAGTNEVVVFVRNITDRRQILEQLRQKEEQLSLIFNNVVDPIFNLQVEPNNIFRFIEVNKALLSHTGLTKEQVIGKDFREVVPKPAHELVLQKYSEAMETRSPVYWEEVSEFPTGKRHGEMSLSPIFNSEGLCTNLIQTVHDVTERRVLEEKQKSLEAQLVEAQKLESIGRLAGGVAHDYNNVLAVVLGYSQLIGKRLDKEDPLRRHMETIESAAKKGASLTRQLLAFARREVILPKPFNPNDAIPSLTKLLRRTIGEDIDVRFIPGSKTWNISMDPTQFDQILLNLATNARDAIGGAGNIVIETNNFTLKEGEVIGRMDMKGGDYVVIAFTDDGKGMSNEIMQKIFEPFFTTKPTGQGTGLGLSTVYGIVKQNGGAINVYSEENVGTTFRIYLPRYYGELIQGDAEEETLDLSGTETILIVEDQAELLELAKNILEEHGYKVLTALNPREGILLSEAYVGTIDLLLTDVVMPDLNGRQLQDRIVSMRPNIKTVFMSGYTADVIATRGVLDEGVDFIQKPFTPYDFSKKIREVLGS